MNITPMSLWFMVLITTVTGAFVNQLITGGPHIVWIHCDFSWIKPLPVSGWNVQVGPSLDGENSESRRCDNFV